jgi:hypothetical protein
MVAPYPTPTTIRSKVSLIVVSVEGVLTDEGPADVGGLINCVSSGRGRTLYSLLRDTGNVMLLSSETNRESAKAWLGREGFRKYAEVRCHPVDSPHDVSAWKVHVVRDLVAVGYSIAFYIDSDPAAVRSMTADGVDSLLLASSAVVPGEDYRDEPYRPWYALTETIEQQSLVRASRFSKLDEGP